MTWFKVDDTLGSHPKARAAGLAAMGLWVVAGAWSSQHLTEGFVPDWFVNSWPSGQKRAANLVQSGLWIEADSGFRFHQWEERNPSKEQVESERAAARERQRKHRESKRDAVVSHGVTDGVTNRTPTRPDPTSSSSGTTRKATRATQIPDDWEPKPAHLEIAVEYGLDPAFQLRSFRDYCQANGKTQKDWDAAFRNWLNKAKSYQRPTSVPAKQEGLFERAMERASQQRLEIVQ
jgi:hypothetical protein